MSDRRHHIQTIFQWEVECPWHFLPPPPQKKTCTTGGFRRKIGHPLRCAPPWPPWVMYPWRPHETNAAPRHFGHDAVAAGLGESSPANGGIMGCWMICCWVGIILYWGWVNLGYWGVGGELCSLRVFLQLPVLAIWSNYLMNSNHNADFSLQLVLRVVSHDVTCHASIYFWQSWVALVSRQIK